MKSKQAKQLIEKIDQSISDIFAFQNISALEQSYLAKFLVVFICGIYEEVIETIVKERAVKCNDPDIFNYIEKSLKYFRNPNIEKIKKLLGSFNSDWELKIGQLSRSAQTAMNNIVTQKNSLAHGINSTITLQEVVLYYKDSMTIINKIDDILLT